MIAKIIEALHSFDYYGETEAIDIAKGKYELADTFKKGKEKIKRQWSRKK